VVDGSAEKAAASCVLEKNLAWSKVGQQGCLIAEQHLDQGLRRNSALDAKKLQARPFLGDVERPGLNSEIKARGGRAVARWVPRTPKVRRRR
jgi:hypothetical protein